MRCDAAAACLVGALVLGVRAHAQADAHAAAKARFEVALTALHDFEYEQANAGFLEVERLDPAFAPGYWGEAMTYYQVLWRNENVAAGRQALAKLAPTPAGRAAKAANPRDAGLLAAADVLFGDGDAAARHARYADAMGRLNAAFPDDPDVATLYALALMGNMSRSLIGAAATQDVRLPGLAGSDVQQRVAAILNRVLAAHPDHHGALHYLLHDYDDPEHAALALPAARTYANVAAGASHALHMPSHVFVQLGLWHDAAASDRASYEASDEWVRRKGLPLALRNYHALSWLQYELLQLGRYKEAHEIIGELEPVVRASGAMTMGEQGGSHQPLLSDLSSMRGRDVVESRHWDAVARQTTFGNANDLFAIGMGAARSGNVGVAETVRQTLAQRSTAPQEGDMRPAIAIMEREIAGLIELAGGRRDNAVAILQAAARSENELPAPLGLPAPLKPAPELLGEVLVEIGRPAEAIVPFEQALQRHRNRSLSVLGLARAAAATGDEATARKRYGELLANFSGADPDLPELQEARAAVSRGRAAFRWNWPISILGGGIVVAAVVIAGWSWRRGPGNAGRSGGKAPRPTRPRPARRTRRS